MKRRLLKAYLLMILLLGMSVVPVFAATEPDIYYQTHVQNVGWQNYVENGAMSGTSGQSLRLEGIRIYLDSNGYDLGVTYQTHIQNIGWETDAGRGWKADNEMSGTSGLSYRLEAIQIKLTGSDANLFDIYYQVHAQNVGWLDWAKNGQSAGTAGLSYRLEGIRIIIQAKGQSAPGPTDTPFKEKLSTAEFINQLYGVWPDESSQTVLILSQTHFYNYIPTPLSVAYGAFDVVSTTDNGGTIRVNDLTVEGYNSGDHLVNFNFGAAGDNMMSWQYDGSIWHQVSAAQNLGGGQYLIPFYFNGSNIISMP